MNINRDEKHCEVASLCCHKMSHSLCGDMRLKKHELDVNRSKNGGFPVFFSLAELEDEKSGNRIFFFCKKATGSGFWFLQEAIEENIFEKIFIIGKDSENQI